MLNQPPSITPEMLHLIAQLDEAKGQWQALRRPATDRLRSLRQAQRLKASALPRGSEQD